MATQGQVITCKGICFIPYIYTLFETLSTVVDQSNFDSHLLHSCGGLRAQQTSRHRRRSSRSPSGWWGSDQDPIHCSLSHRRLHLERQGSLFSLLCYSLGIQISDPLSIFRILKVSSHVSSVMKLLGTFPNHHIQFTPFVPKRFMF